MKIGDNLLVSPNPQGEWPNHEKWMRGQNEATGREGDFPGGQYVEFVNEFTLEPEPVQELPPPLPNSIPGHVTEDAPPTPPRRGNSVTRISENHDAETRPPQAPPRPTPRKRTTSAHQQQALVESLECSLNTHQQPLQATVDERSHDWIEVSFQIPLRCAACKLYCPHLYPCCTPTHLFTIL